MSVTRRNFLLSSAVAAASATVTRSAAAQEPAAKPEATLKLSSQLTVIPGKDLAEKLANMERWGFDGVELSGDVVGKEKMYQDAVNKTRLKISAVCWGSNGGSLVSDVVSKRAPGVAALKRVLTSAGAVGSTGVVYVPAFNGQTELTNQEIRKLLIDTLPDVGEHAHQAGTRVVMEPLNRGEAFFLRLVADAAAIARDCKSPGIGVMGDFYHMAIEEPSDLGAFISGGPYVHHVHLASRTRVLPGQDERPFVDGFRGLKWIGFHDYCSLECGVRGDRSVEIPKAVVFLREQWAEA